MTIANIAGVFVNELTGSGNNLRVIVNFMNYTGVVPAGGEWNTGGSFLKILRIVE